MKRFLFAILKATDLLPERINTPAGTTLHVVAAPDADAAIRTIARNGKPRRGERIIFLGQTNQLQMYELAPSKTFGGAATYGHYDYDIEPAMWRSMRNRLRKEEETARGDDWRAQAAGRAIAEIRSWAETLCYPEGWEQEG